MRRRPYRRTNACLNAASVSSAGVPTPCPVEPISNDTAATASSQDGNDHTPSRSDSPDAPTLTSTHWKSGSGLKSCPARKSAAPKIPGKKPLIGESKSLSTQIYYRVTGNTVVVRSTPVYGAAQQFGARKGAIGRNRRGAPIPRGDVPARPFLGPSTADEAMILDEFRSHIDSAG
ncbi:MAG: phage virion morphogenesis protein [Thiotrichales bacterium]